MNTLQKICQSGHKVGYAQLGSLALPKENLFVVGQDLAKISAVLPEYQETDPKDSGNSENVVGLKNVKVCRVSTEASRYNCQYRPDKVTKEVSSFLSGKDAPVTFALASTSREQELAHLLAVVRSIPAFSLKTDKKFPDVQILTNQLSDADYLYAEYVRRAAAITDAPPNYLSTHVYRELIQSEVETLNARLSAAGRGCVTIKEFVGHDLKKNGMMGIYNVGMAADFESSSPMLVILSYEPKPEEESVCLVGKGIIYDCGGLAIKPAPSMCGMKRDMGGSAATLFGFLNTVSQGYEGNLHCLMCLAENSITAGAMRNDDIITMYSGLTVEVHNTDAEGRLVMGDGVAYASKHLKPKLVIDAATLTGAQGFATGHFHAAILSNSGAHETQVLEAGRRIGDLCSPLPFTPELHMEELKSEFADVRNIPKNRDNASSATAGLFMLKNLEKTGYKGDWVHIDLAFPVHWTGDRATGFGVGLLSEYLGQLQ